ncbi:MAG: hypothetical protein AAGF88_03030 [Pseudomonadota bacterium]
MFITLVGTIAAGFLGGGCVLLLRFVFKDRVPKWALPITAGAFMLAATISSEYGWFRNTAANLPGGVEVVATHERQAPWQPWTYAAPYVNSFIAFDRGSVRTNADTPSLKIADLFIYTRWQPPRQVQLAVDCDAGLRADPAEGVEMDDDGRPVGVTWREVPQDDALMRAACG